MVKFSVKKPLTVLVSIIAVLALGIVAYFKMTPDLLPNMDFPYVMIMTTYPGASPEKVENEISKPMEQSMSTLEYIKEVTSTSSENVSMVMLEFEEAVNMDTIGVDIQQKISAMESGWSDTVGAPYVLKINPSLLPVEVAAVSMKGMDTIALTEFLDDTLMNKLEGIPGVARITATGMISQELHVVLDQDLIDAANRKVMDAINKELDEAKKELTDQQKELEDTKEDMKDAQDKLDDGTDAILDGEKQLKEQKNKLLKTQEELKVARETLETAVTNLTDLKNNLKTAQDAEATAQKAVEGLTQLIQLRDQLAEMEAGIEALKAQILMLEGATDEVSIQMREQLQAQLIQLEGTYAAMQAAFEGGLLSAGVTADKLDEMLLTAQNGLAQAQQALATIDQALAGQNMTRESLSATLKQVKSQLKEVKNAQKQLESGMLTIEEAENKLEEQKLKGLTKISTAAGQLAAGTSSVESGLSQIEKGLEQLEESREDALKQADLNGILTMDMVTKILQAQNFYMPAGYVKEDGINYMVSVGEEITERAVLEELLLLDLDMEGVDPIYLKDVAVITLTDNRNETYAKLDGQDSVMLSFEKQSTYATAETTDNIASRFAELAKEYPGLRFVSLMNQGDYIYLVVESILKNLFLGALFSVLILLLFLRDLRPTLITLCAIPISVVFAIVLMYFSGVSLNMISLSGLAIAVGMLVDNSVVVIENIYRLRAKGANVIQAAVSGAGQVVGAVTASTLTTICVFVPIVFVEGLTRQLFTDLALTMTYALLASLIISLTLVPAMASGLLRKERKSKEGRVGTAFLRGYRATIRWAIRLKPVVLILSAGLLVFTAWASLSKGFTFMPSLDSQNVTVTISMPEGVDMHRATALADEVMARTGKIEGVSTMGAMLGGGLSLSSLSGNNFDVTVYVTLESEEYSGNEVSRQIEKACENLACEVSATAEMMDMSMLTGSGISVRLYGDDMEKLQDAARITGEAMADVAGVAEVSDGLEDAEPAIHVAIDRNGAMKYGLTVAQIYMELAEGITADGTVATMELDEVSTDVIIEKPKGAVLDLQSLRDYVFEVTDREGNTKEVPLSEFAEVQETKSLSTISRIGQRRYMTVTATPDDGENVTLLTNRAERMMAKTGLPQGVSYEFTGENEAIMEAMEQLLLMLLLGVLLVYLIMVAQFQSLLSPFIVMFTIPLAFTGGFMALLVCGMEMSIISMIGFVMLVGIIVNNGIVLVDYINQLRLGGMERREAIVEACVTRLRPILMTTLTTVLGQLVMAMSTDVGSLMMRPIAVVSIGGLLYATLMTLYVVPCIYDWMCKKELRNIKEEDLKLLDL